MILFCYIVYLTICCQQLSFFCTYQCIFYRSFLPHYWHLNSVLLLISELCITTDLFHLLLNTASPLSSTSLTTDLCTSIGFCVTYYLPLHHLLLTSASLMPSELCIPYYWPLNSNFPWLTTEFRGQE